MREEDPARQLADRIAAEDIRRERGDRRHRREPVEAEDGGEQIEARNVQDDKEEEQRQAAKDVVAGERALSSETIADPSRCDRAEDAGRSHHTERLRRHHLRESMLDRMRNQVSADQPARRPAADEVASDEQQNAGTDEASVIEMR